MSIAAPFGSVSSDVFQMCFVTVTTSEPRPFLSKPASQSVEGVKQIPESIPAKGVLQEADATVTTVVGRALNELHSAIATALLEAR